jgi:hypothetical protein
MARCGRRVMLVMMLPSHASDGSITQGCTSCGKVAQPPSSEHQSVVAT